MDNNAPTGSLVGVVDFLESATQSVCTKENDLLKKISGRVESKS